MNIQASIQLPVLFKPDRLQEDLDKIYPNEWISHYRGEHYEGRWAVAPLRSVAGHPAVIYATPSNGLDGFYRNTAILERCTYFQEVIAWFQCPINAVRLMLLSKDARILEHTDDMNMGDFQEWRIHIPVQTHTDVAFWVDGKHVPMQEGEVWYADFNLPHRVENGSPIDRVHLVLDCVPNEWLKNQLDIGKDIGMMRQFLHNIGIQTSLQHLNGETFLPGIKIENGHILIDLNRLKYPGDILHEAGHIAVVTPEKRTALNGNIGKGDPNDLGDEIAAILWSFAAVKALELSEELVFHKDGYRGSSDWYISNFKIEKNYMGLPLLEWMGMAASDNTAAKLGILPFPAMMKWLRE